MTRFLMNVVLAIAAGASLLPTTGRADDTLKLAVGAPNNWDSGLPDIGKRAGIFKKHELDLDILYTNGGGETLQAVISGSVDLGIASRNEQRARRLREGRAGANPAGGNDGRGRSLLVRASALAA